MVVQQSEQQKGARMTGKLREESVGIYTSALPTWMLKLQPWSVLHQYKVIPTQAKLHKERRSLNHTSRDPGSRVMSGVVPSY